MSFVLFESAVVNTDTHREGQISLTVLNQEILPTQVQNIAI